MCKFFRFLSYLYIYYTKNFKNRPTTRRAEYLRRLCMTKGNERDFTPARPLDYPVALVADLL